MKKDKFIIIKTTYPNKNSAIKLSKILLKEKLAACIELKKIESLYSWQGKIENDAEISVAIKTVSKNFDKIAKIIKENHSYKLPQIIAIPLISGTKEYLSWIETNSKNKDK